MTAEPTFADLGVNPKLAEALRHRKIFSPFAIQTLVVPDGVAGHDLLGRAPTGSGKTLAFGVPALHRLADLEPSLKKRPRALILSPTRELAEQISQELEPLAQAIGRSVLAVYGGVPILRHIKALSRGVDLLVACPGRLIDLIEQGAVSLGDTEIAVVDEADRMADMGFLPDVKKLLDKTADHRQTLLFSATLDKEVQVLVDRYQTDPRVHEIGEAEPDLSLMEHRFIQVVKTERVPLAADLIHEAGPTVVFCRTRHGVDRLARQLRAEGIASGHIHGGRSQSQRDRALQVFTDGKVSALVATDVAARGIHVDGVACVIHYDPPADVKDYVHRSGRTARAGATGVVVSLIDKGQVKESFKMQRQLGIEADLEAKPDPLNRDRSAIQTGSDRQHARSKNASSGKPRSGKPKSATAKSKPGSGSSRRSQDGEQRSSSRAKPSSNGAKHSSNKTKRSSNGAKPSSNGAKPSSNGEKPSSNRAKPSSNKAKSSSGGERRSSNGEDRSSAKPNRSSGKPKANGASGRRSQPAKKAGAKGAPARAGAKGSSTGGANGERPTSGKPKRAAKRAAAKATGRSGKPRQRNRKNKAKFRSS